MNPTPSANPPVRPTQPSRGGALAPGSALYRRQAWTARAVAAWSRVAGGRADGFGILTYHRVSPRRRDCAPNLNVTPARFRSQLAGLRRKGYQPWPLSRLIEHHAAERAIPPAAFAIVFDDGYAGVCEHALPILQELEAPATVFLPTAFLGSRDPFPFDDWPGAGDPRWSDAWRPLDRIECGRLLESGLVEIGSHSHTHQNFCESPEALRGDLERSLQALASEFDIQRPAFAFPFGDSKPELSRIAEQAGAACSLTGECQLIRPHDSPFGWGRFGAEQYDTAATLAAKLNGAYSRAKRAWGRIKRRLTLERKR